MPSSPSCRRCARTRLGAGATLAAWERELLGRAAPAAGVPDGAGPLPLHRGRVPADWIDYNGHVHESRYLQLFGDATDVLLSRLGVDAAHLAGGGSYFTVETHLRHLRELAAGDAVTVTTQVLGADEKRLHVFHVLRCDGDEAPVATAEQMLLHVDTERGRAAPAGERLLAEVMPPPRRACGSAAPGACRPGRRRAMTTRPDAALRPASVAIVGVSSDPGKWGYWFARDAVKGRHRRTVHLVGRSGGELHGLPVHRSLAELPEPPDLVVLSVPAAALEEAVDESLAAGAKALVAIAAGLGELGPEGAKRERAIAERVRAAGALLVGPNCLGVFDAEAELELASNPVPSGPIGFVSQSGNIALETGLLLADVGLGYSRLVSVGNQADVDVTEVVAALAAHDGTQRDRRLLRGFPRRPRVRRDCAHRREAGRAPDGRPDRGCGPRGAVPHRSADERPRRGRRGMPRGRSAPRRHAPPARRCAAGPRQQAARRAGAASASSATAAATAPSRATCSRGTALELPAPSTRSTQAALRIAAAGDGRDREPGRPGGRRRAGPAELRAHHAYPARGARARRRALHVVLRRLQRALGRAARPASSPRPERSPRRCATPAGRSSSTRCTGTRRLRARCGPPAFPSTGTSSRRSRRSTPSRPTAAVAGPLPALPPPAPAVADTGYGAARRSLAVRRRAVRGGARRREPGGGGSPQPPSSATPSC